MFFFVSLVLLAPEPGQYPGGPNTGYVPPPQEQERPKVYDEPSSEPVDPDAYVRPGSVPPSASQRKVRDDIELGYRRMLRKDPFGALSAFKDALRKNPNDKGAQIAIAEANYAIALFFQRRGRVNEARRAYAEALAADPSFFEDEDFRWHYELAHDPASLPASLPARAKQAEKKKPKLVDDGRASFLQRPWIGPHIVVGPDSLVGVGAGAAFFSFWRNELTFDPIFVALCARMLFYVPSWSFTPYLSVGGRLAFLNPPIGRAPQRPGLEIWGTSFGSVGAGLQYSHAIGFYATLGIEMLFIGNQRVGAVNADPSPFNPGTIVYPLPLPQLSIGWLFGG
ncbi:MAG: hypothetical protein IT381_07125 [Deltaproteobacteria bacterium]|nr:hypothetical protein [Deltaproteobacteria bacterium]